MSEGENNFSTSMPPKTLKLQKIDIKKLQIQHEELQARVSGLKDMLTEKESLIKSQRTSMKLQEEKIAQLSLNNDTLRHMVLILSKHVTEVLKETLPVLPPIPQDHLANVDSLLAATQKKEKKSKHRLKSSIDLKDFYSNRYSVDASSKKQSNYYDFSGSDILSAISDMQDVRRAAQQAAKAQGRYTIVTSHRISLFEGLSLFLSLRNVAFLNNFEVFLPRVLEMMTDLLDIERIILYVYDEEQFYSMAMTGDIAKQMVIPKGFSHLYSAIEQATIISQAYEDSRFDMRYDQISGFKTNNLACFPLKIGEDFIGILECANKKAEFMKEDIMLLTLAAKQIALGVAGKLYQDSIKDLAYESVKPSLSNKENLVFSALKSIALSIKSFVACEKVSLYTISSDKTELKCSVSSENTQNFSVSLNYSFPGLCFTSKKALTITNAQEHSMLNPDIEKKLGITTREILLIPLAELGVIECINKTKGFSSRDEAKALSLAMVAKNLLEAENSFEDVLAGADISEIFSEHVSESLICLNYSGVIIKVNNSASILFQTSKEAMVKRSISQVFENAEDLMRIVMKNKIESQTKIERIRIKGKLTNIEIIYKSLYFAIVITTI